MPDPTDLTVPARFCGPPSSGNGGWSAGAIAVRAARACPDPASHGDGSGPALPTVTVSLLAPPPLDAPMPVRADPTADDGRVVATYDGGPVLSARCSHEPVTDVEPVAADVARAAEATYAGLTSHPFPTCFACGTGREVGDGLRIFPGRVPDATPASGGDPQPRVAATWTPTEQPDVPITWAALDCVGGWAGDLEDRLMVLGRMTARLDALPTVGEEHVVVGMGHRREGRKTWTSASLYDASGRVVGTAEHLWIAVDPADFA